MDLKRWLINNLKKQTIAKNVIYLREKIEVFDIFKSDTLQHLEFIIQGNVTFYKDIGQQCRSLLNNIP